jgi:glycosyltransferase involved in cell wall biosynthesis
MPNPDSASAFSVLFVLSRDAVGGTENHVAMLVERLPAYGVEGELVTFDAPGPVSARAEAAGARVHALGDGPSRKLVGRLAGVIRNGPFDLILAYGFRAGMLARAARLAVRHSPPLVVGVRGLFNADLLPGDRAMVRATLAADALTSPPVAAFEANSSGALTLLSRARVPRRKLLYVPNGIDLHLWPTPARVLEPGEPPRIACVARLTPVKDHASLLEALALLRGAAAGAELHLAGTGPEEPALRKLAAGLGIAHRVRFHGDRPAAEVRKLLEGSDLFCTSSLSEGMPTAVLEAMAAGLGVVGSDVNGISDLVEDGRTGRLVPPGSPRALAAGLEEALNNPLVARAWGAAGRDRVQRHFSLDDVLARRAALYRGLARL